MKTFLPLILFIAIVSCSSDNEPYINQPGSNKVDLTSYFPLAIDNRWIYKVDGVENTFTEFLIVDTLRDNTNKLVYRAKEGILNFPDNEYSDVFLMWDSDGLWKYYCYDDSCYNDSLNLITPDFKLLLIKSEAEIEEKWGEGSRIFQLSDISDYRLFYPSEIDTVLEKVAIIDMYYTYSEKPIRNYYAPNIGFIGNDSASVLIEYRVK